MDPSIKLKVELQKQYEQLNFLYQFPRLYLKQYFNDMKSRINLAFAKKDILCRDEKIKEELRENWIQISELINSIENESLKRIQMNKFSSETNRKIEFLNEKIKSNAFDSNLIDLAYELITQMESIIFLNKTIIFVEHSDLTKDLKCSLFGKIVIITNEHLNTLLFKERMYDDKKLTLDVVKLNEIIKTSFKNKLVIETNLDLKRVSEVSFSDYNLSSIETGLFKNMTHLVSIDLSNNQLTELDTHLFSSLIHLSHIDLSSNLLHSIHSNLFKNLINLNEVFLSNNKLKTIDKHLFDGLIYLSFIDLSCNEIESLDFSMFNHLKSLKFVCLHGNKFKSFESKLFMANLKSRKKNFLSLYI